MNFLSNMLRAIAEFFGWANKHTELKNAPDVRAAEVGQNEADARSQVEKHVAQKDLDELRKELAE